MESLLDEDLVPFAAGIRTLPGRPHVSWGYRAIKGIRGVQLETILVGGRRWTSRQALRRFIDRVTAAASLGNVQVTTPPKPEQDLPEQDERTDQQLDQAGL